MIFAGWIVLLQRKEGLCGSSLVCEDGAEPGGNGQRWAWPVLDKVTEDLVLVGPFPLVCVSLWQIITLLWAKTSGCSQPLLSQL